LKSVSLADDFALDADELEDVIGCWWSQTESNRRPLQCHLTYRASHGVASRLIANHESLKLPRFSLSDV
jgi:hypothetical protein